MRILMHNRQLFTFDTDDDKIAIAQLYRAKAEDVEHPLTIVRGEAPVYMMYCIKYEQLFFSWKPIKLSQEILCKMYIGDKMKGFEYEPSD